MNHDLGSSENSSTSQISVPFLLSRYLFAEPADKTRIIMEYTVGISTSQNLESDQIGDLYLSAMQLCSLWKDRVYLRKSSQLAAIRHYRDTVQTSLNYNLHLLNTFLSLQRAKTHYIWLCTLVTYTNCACSFHLNKGLQLRVLHCLLRLYCAPFLITKSCEELHKMRCP